MHRLRALAVLALAATLTSGALSATGAASAAAPASRPLSVVVEPQAGYGFLDHAVNVARHSIVIELYELNDATFESDLIAARARHVTVEVLLDKDYDGGYVNAAAYSTLAAHHVAVRWANDGYVFHEKALVIDGTAYVGTGNLTAEYYATTRDFWVVDHQRADVAAIAATFRADWTGAPPRPEAKGVDLVWSPSALSTVLALINHAHHSISLESEELSSPSVVSALAAAARRHVTVHVTMTYSSSWASEFAELVAAGASVHVDHGESPIYVHAKALCIDCAAGTHPHGTLLVGSQNLATYSLTQNRELSVLTGSPGVVGTVDATLNADFAQAQPYG